MLLPVACSLNSRAQYPPYQNKRGTSPMLTHPISSPPSPQRLLIRAPYPSCTPHAHISGTYLSRKILRSSTCISTSLNLSRKKHPSTQRAHEHPQHVRIALPHQSLEKRACMWLLESSTAAGLRGCASRMTSKKR